MSILTDAYLLTHRSQQRSNTKKSICTVDRNELKIIQNLISQWRNNQFQKKEMLARYNSNEPSILPPYGRPWRITTQISQTAVYIYNFILRFFKIFLTWYSRKKNKNGQDRGNKSLHLSFFPWYTINTIPCMWLWCRHWPIRSRKLITHSVKTEQKEIFVSDRENSSCAR